MFRGWNVVSFRSSLFESKYYMLRGANRYYMLLKRTALIASMLLCFFSLFSAAQAQSLKGKGDLPHFDTGGASKNARVLNFPKDYSLGEIIISNTPLVDEHNGKRGAAKGKIVVPAKQYVCFVPSHRFFLNPAISKSLPADGIDNLWLAAASLDDSEDGLCDRALAAVGHFKSAIELNLDRSDATDSGAKHAADFPKLQKFSAFLALLDGSCFKSFSTLKHLNSISVKHNMVKDENLKYLADVPQLKFLDLSQNGLSDKGVKDLVKCKNLTTLILANNHKLTDQSLETLAQFKKLQILSLVGTSVTARALLRLKGVPLKVVELASDSYPSSVMAKLKATFPGVIIRTHTSVRTPDADTKALYAPLH
ncbi:hypothetical protein BH11CYA1_BH11CYA1_34830 [soil metagenome]